MKQRESSERKQQAGREGAIGKRPEGDPGNRSDLGKGIRILMVLFLLQGGLVATHEGEFWPFSIYPMFSNPGAGWTRSLVMEAGSVPDLSAEVAVSEPSGNVFPLNRIGLNQNDLADLVSRTWYRSDPSGMSIRHLFRQTLEERDLVIWLARGRVDEERRGVVIDYTPSLWMNRDTVMIPEVGIIPEVGMAPEAGMEAGR